MSHCLFTVSNQLQYSLIFWFLSSSSPVVKKSQIQYQNMCYFTKKKMSQFDHRRKMIELLWKWPPSPTTLLWFWGQNIVGNSRYSIARFFWSANFINLFRGNFWHTWNIIVVYVMHYGNMLLLNYLYVAPLAEMRSTWRTSFSG